MKIISFLFGILLAENPECHEDHKRICEARKGFKCVGKWNYWGKEKFECRKTCIDENCGNCSNSGTEYKYSELTKNGLRSRRKCKCKRGYIGATCKYFSRAVLPDIPVFFASHSFSSNSESATIIDDSSDDEFSGNYLPE